MIVVTTEYKSHLGNLETIAMDTISEIGGDRVRVFPLSNDIFIKSNPIYAYLEIVPEVETSAKYERVLLATLVNSSYGRNRFIRFPFNPCEKIAASDGYLANASIVFSNYRSMEDLKFGISLTNQSLCDDEPHIALTYGFVRDALVISNFRNYTAAGMKVLISIMTMVTDPKNQ